MNNLGRAHPLDKLINDDSLFLLEAMVPFVDYQYKLPLIFYIKYREITLIMQCMNDKEYISKCGFDCHPQNQEEMFRSICSFLPGDYANTFKQMKQMMSMMEVMNSMQTPDSNSSNHYQKTSDNFQETPDNLQKTPYSFQETSDNLQKTPYSFQETPDKPQSNSDDLYESVMSILNERN